MGEQLERDGPCDTAALTTSLCSTGARATWTDAPAASEEHPINCINWYVAMAFCV